MLSPYSANKQFSWFLALAENKEQIKFSEALNFCKSTEDLEVRIDKMISFIRLLTTQYLKLNALDSRMYKVSRPRPTIC